MFTFVWRTVFRNLIYLAHHLVIVVLVLGVYGWREANAPAALLGLILMVANASWLSMMVGIASARFRDIPQIVGSVMQFAFLFTPVFWRPDSRASLRAVLDLNPFYHLLETVRAPLLGQAVDPQSYLVLVAMAVVGWALTFALFARTRRRIVHYL
jgi:ABC-type polysaccharide/polyol phosphate export permease